MKLTLTRIYGKADSGREAGLHSFDMEVEGVSSPAEFGALIEKLTELRSEMTGSMDDEKDYGPSGG